MFTNRQLAVIMFTDIVGYTSLMGEDEQKAFDTILENRRLQQPLIEKFNGKWIKELGDGVLASFQTVTDAVLCAIAIQKKVKEENDFQLRIGIHLGEVVFENNDVFGDGVNIASRIQTIAPPGEIYLTEAVYDNVFNKKDIHARFITEASLKNVKGPVKIYQVNIDDGSVEYSIPMLKRESANGQKSIAVLPFVNLSNDKEQDYFCEGVAEEILNSLSHLKNLRVISRTSAFALKDKNLGASEIGRLLNVESLLEGSVRKAGNRLRITTKLISVSDGSQLWSERYDHELEDIFSIQENIAENVATALRGVLTSKEKDAMRRPETNIETYEYFLKGKQYYHRLSFNESKKYFERAIELDPEYALAYAGLADVYSWLYAWEGGNPADLEAAENNSRKALSLAPDLSQSHTAIGSVLALSKKYQAAEKEFKKAIRLNPNSYGAYYSYGRTCFAQGETKKAAELFLKASQVRREDYQSMLLLAQCLRILGKKEAIETSKEGMKRARKQLELDPSDRRVLSLGASELLHSGEREEALAWITKALELYPDDAGVLINGTCIYAIDNQIEKALDLLEIAVGKGYGKRDWIEHDPDYDSLREEPRFKALMKKLP